MLRDFGLPKIWSCDNGPEFRNNVIASLATLFGTTGRHTSPYYPQANGLAERTVGTTLQGIRKTLRGRDTAWMEMLPAVQLAENARFRDSIGCTPFEAMFGRALST